MGTSKLSHNRETQCICVVCKFGRCGRYLPACQSQLVYRRCALGVSARTFSAALGVTLGNDPNTRAIYSHQERDSSAHGKCVDYCCDSFSGFDSLWKSCGYLVVLDSALYSQSIGTITSICVICLYYNDLYDL